MDLKHLNGPLGLTGDPKEFGHTEASSCKFEITQVKQTTKLKRGTVANAFKTKLKPFLGTNTQDNLKISLSGLLNDTETQLKRSLEQVYTQDNTNAPSAGIFTRSKAGGKVKKYKESPTKKRKAVRNSSSENINTLNQPQVSKTTQAPVKKEPQVVEVPVVVAEEPPKSNMKNLTRAKTKTEKRPAELSAKAPLYIQKLYEKIESGADDQYKKKFFGSFKSGNESKKTKLFDFPKLPVDFELPPAEGVKGDFIYDLDIITNQNQKERIKISFQPGKVEQFSEIPNPMYKEDRDKFFSEFNFTMDYRSGYAPIDVQAKQEKEFTYKNHFIKKKQSCANGSLKRVYGVSYVKKLESHQLNVNHIFQKLNPLVFQGSTGCVRLDGYQAVMKNATDKMFKEGPGCYFIVTLLEAEDESLMREYLYFPERRMKLTKGKVYLLKSLDALWFFFKDKHFVCIHLIYDDKEFLKKAEMQQPSLHDLDEALRKSNVQIGILCKKGLSGKKSFLKTFTEGLDREGLGVDSDSDEEEDPNKEHDKEKPKEDFIAPKKKMKAEMKEQREKEKREKRERREQEKKEKKEKQEELKKEKLEQREKDKKEKLLKLRSTKSANRENGLTNKQLHFFDKCKLKLEKENMFGDGVMKEMFAGVDEIMQPYLKLLFIKGFTYTPKGARTAVDETAAPSVSGMECADQITVDQTPMTHDDSRSEMMSGLATPSVIPTRSEMSTEKKTFTDIEEKSEEMNDNKEDHKSEMQVEVEEPRKEDSIEPSKTAIETEETSTIAADEHKVPSEPKDPVKEAMLEAIRQTPLYEFIREIKKAPGINTVTLSGRIELYTHEDSWKSADEHTKNLLYTFILHVTDLMFERFRNWTLKRTELTKANTAVLFSDTTKEIDLFEYDANALEAYTERVPLDASNLNWHFNPEIKDAEHLPTEDEDNSKNKKYFKGLKNVSLVDLQGLSNLQKETTSLNLPLYIINTRDSFAFDLIEKKTELEMCGRKVIKTDYYFDPSAYPSNFKVFYDKFPDYHVGVTTYTNFFTHEEMLKIEERCYETERRFLSNHFLPMTGQMTATNDKVRRTKFFFGARYMWTRQQLSEPHSMVGAGIRCDVSERPTWMKNLVEDPMVDAGILEKDFVNSIAMNVYHDGKEGLAQHFDDAVRFKQPIFTLRIFSDSRLSFGSQFYGFCNGAFCIPMPRGCITVLAEESYAANGVKHCVRPCDMTGKSAALILRQMHYKVFNEAQLYNEFVDFPTWFSTLSIKDNAVSYNDQKRLEADELLKNKNQV